MPVFDFNLFRHFGHDTPRFSRKGMANERWTDHLRSTHGLFAETRIQPLRAAVLRQPPNPELLLPRPVSLHGFRPTDLLRKPAGYRNLSAAMQSKLDHAGIRGNVSRSTLADANETRDAHLRRLRRGADHPSAASLCPRRVWRNPGTDRLRFRLDDDRLFEKTPILQALSASCDELENTENHNQLSLFDLKPDTRATVQIFPTISSDHKWKSIFIFYFDVVRQVLRNQRSNKCLDPLG